MAGASRWTNLENSIRPLDHGEPCTFLSAFCDHYRSIGQLWHGLGADALDKGPRRRGSIAALPGQIECVEACDDLLKQSLFFIMMTVSREYEARFMIGMTEVGR